MNKFLNYLGPGTIITTNLEIRSMGPISELDMVILYILSLPLIFTYTIFLLDLILISKLSLSVINSVKDLQSI